MGARESAIERKERERARKSEIDKGLERRGREGTLSLAYPLSDRSLLVLKRLGIKLVESLRISF
eukprot:1388100-Amorphochlora_amoeboformis.AAC.1